ncbi:hypothetical protein [Melghirimyces algeriensis]|uniref:Uncharacterized protein n=1 Tax=Melghirimyces algeriensis TaxID=910412 RepID=A0A521DNQ5_9BACL|nr:hypothetical protein [Melghirimyces algeriensis]SMO72701.1 hypothetical protein SAMN06264849_106125 [Melghirimyces algeriensis]
MGKKERIASLVDEAQKLCKSPQDDERPEDKLIEILVELAKGTRYWEDVQGAIESYERYQKRTEGSEESEEDGQPRTLPWRL